MSKKPKIDKKFNHYKPIPSRSSAPFNIFNIGNGKKVHLMKFINILEKKLGSKIKKNFLPMQMGDVRQTLSDISKLNKVTGYDSKTDVDEGVSKFVDWYNEYFKKKN